MLIFVIEVLRLITNVQWVKWLLPWNDEKTVCNHCLLQQAFTAHSKVMPIHFINSNDNYNYVGLICNSMVCCSIWINSARNAGMKSITVLSCASHYYNFPTCSSWNLKRPRKRKFQLSLNKNSLDKTFNHDFTV